MEAARQFAREFLDGAQVVSKFGNTSFSVNGKVFAFTRPDGLLLKLPVDVLAKVLAEQDAEPLTMGKRTMREWILLRLNGPESYRNETDLMRIAMTFVS